MKLNTLIGSFALAMAIFCAPTLAGTIEIQFTGLNLTYDGSSIVDSAVGADPLTTVSLKEDSVDFGGSPLQTPADAISLELAIPGVTNIPVGGGTVNSAVGGSLMLNLPSGDHVSLDLDSVAVTYVDLSGTIRFAFGGSIATIDSQQLPSGAMLGDPVAVSFSTRLDAGSLTDDGTYITGFTSRGTGEIEGELVPEPTTAALGALAALFAGAAAMRFRLG
ncbi:hypothetical protein Mal64_21380 [Pseudobythopirellula maris]|uniref:PEP-CTERM protein-sorting domain-containing protein n=1 Tax=Pseudobythopirellula maris TaxID=2527991 RepID=A0A5C5ZPE4_9BACT|nr:hypothetical protein [Pseudobythopirellula maris]TWT88651.1 hypothetical protein Mal64_21380 [Pseudobythopirellula maris]